MQKETLKEDWIAEVEEGLRELGDDMEDMHKLEIDEEWGTVLEEDGKLALFQETSNHFFFDKKKFELTTL